ncbi:unnamed protein product [Amoebophrya sp. A120]|nr:unnamed protein product [Amoebophrya sp. A120]|eukprot:GSA120T00025439001.1
MTGRNTASLCSFLVLVPGLLQDVRAESSSTLLGRFFGMESKRTARDVSACPGEGGRYGDYKCNHDSTHRVCAKLVEGTGGSCAAKNWGSSDFWSITGQPSWAEDICGNTANPGDSWCICMWAYATLIGEVGCDNAPVTCAGTDVSYVLQQYNDNGVDLAAAHDCLKSKCGNSTSSSSLLTSSRKLLRAVNDTTAAAPAAHAATPSTSASGRAAAGHARSAVDFVASTDEGTISNAVKHADSDPVAVAA